MKKILSILFISISFTAIAGNGITDAVLVKFASDNSRDFEKVFPDDRDKFVANSIKNADDFILSFLNTHSSNCALHEAITFATESKYYTASNLDMAINLPDDEITDNYRFSFHKMPIESTPTYLLFISDGIALDTQGREYFSFGTFRILQCDSKKQEFNIAAKFEDTNFYAKIIEKQRVFDPATKHNLARKHKNPLDHYPCYSLEGEIMPYYSCYGGRLDENNGEPFVADQSGNIAFTTRGTIPPNLTRIHTYQIDWLWEPRRKELKATTLHWNIHEEPLPDGSDTRTVETKIDLTK